MIKNQQGYENAKKRAEEMLAQMNLTEKIGQISQFGTSIYTNDEQIFEDHFKEGKVGSYLTIRGSEKTNHIQELLMAITRLKIPALFAEDVIHGYRTTAPIPLAQSCTWEPELTRENCEQAAKEAYAAGIKWTFSPMVDIARDPRWGRIAEGYGEDPYLCSDFARAAVRGYQGDYIGQKDHVLACMKHYVAYGACVGGRDYDSVDMSMQTLYDIYLPSFKAGIDAGAATVMASFNDVNGVPCSGNRYLLRDVLRDQLGFDGFVVSDANSVMELIPHGYAADAKDAARLAFGGGVDMLMAGDLYNDSLPELIREGKIDPKLVDDSVLVILTLKYMLGLFEEPYVPKDEESAFFTKEAIDAAYRIAKEAIVLLENDGTLPLSGKESVALVGPLASDARNVLGTWGCLTDETHTVTIEAGLKEAIGNVTAIRGCGFGDEKEEGDWKKEIADAVNKAIKSDVIVACVGESANMSGEAASRHTLEFPGHQKELIDALLATGKKVVLLVGAGRPLILSDYVGRAAAIVCMWHLGTETGHAVADVLTGKHNPSGHLSVSFPRSTGQIPVYYNHYATGKPVLNQRRFEAKYQDIAPGALYPFGYGKSYTEFTYSDLSISSDTMKKDGTIEATVKVKNTGKFDGSDVVQLYVRDLVGSRVRPVKELKGYRKLFLKAGEEAQVSFSLSGEALSFTDMSLQRVTEPGAFKLWVAHDSDDNALEKDFRVIE